jgi:hypothetical protein
MENKNCSVCCNAQLWKQKTLALALEAETTDFHKWLITTTGLPSSSCPATNAFPEASSAENSSAVR